MPNISCNSFLVAGTKYRCEAGNLRTFGESDRLLLRREPTNKFDSNAIAVYANVTPRLETASWLHIGYIPKDVARHLSPMLAAGLKLHATVRRIEPAKLLVWAELVWEKEETVDEMLDKVVDETLAELFEEDKKNLGNEWDPPKHGTDEYGVSEEDY